VRDGYAGEGLRRSLGDALVGRARLRELFSASTVMKALSEPFSFSTRSRKSRVSSTLEIFLCASAAESSLREAFNMGFRIQARRFLPPTLRLALVRYSITFGTR